MLLKLKLLQLNINNPQFLQEINLHQQVIASKRLATYYGDIGVGKGVGDQKDRVQTFKMLFDTGSCEFWIPGQSCTTPRCQTHTRYQTSYKFKEYNGAMMSIQYLSGKVQGLLATESIFLNDLEVPNQVIGISTDVEIPLLDEVIWDGILGLAYPNQNLKNSKILPLFDNMIFQKSLTNKGEKNQFAYYLGPDTGAISFGGADMRYKRSLKDEFRFAPISDDNYWTVNLRDIRKVENSEQQQKTKRFLEMNEKKEPSCPLGCKTIVDTGTYLIYGPQDKVNEILAGINMDNCSDKQKLPNIELELFGEVRNGNQELVRLTLTPEDYVLHFKIDGADDCVVGIVPDNIDSGWTLGQVFLKAYYTLFDRDNNRIGFVRANPNPGPPVDTNSSTFEQKLQNGNQTILNNTYYLNETVRENEGQKQSQEGQSFQKQEASHIIIEDNSSNSNVLEEPNLLEQSTNDQQMNQINEYNQNTNGYNGAIVNNQFSFNYPYSIQINDLNSQ